MFSEAVRLGGFPFREVSAHLERNGVVNEFRVERTFLFARVRRSYHQAVINFVRLDEIHYLSRRKVSLHQ